MNEDFALCSMADDLLLLTLDMCDRDGKTPRTPKRLHRSLTDRIVLTACAVQEAVILANETELRDHRLERAEAGRRRTDARESATALPGLAAACASCRVPERGI